MNIHYLGISPAARSRLLSQGVDDAGAPIIPFVDDEGGWPLRCCLADSVVGDEIAIVGHSPFSWVSPYRETGPIVIHTNLCPGHDGSFPQQFEARSQVIKAFGTDSGRDRTQVYDLNALVPPDASLEDHIHHVLHDPRVSEVHVHNVVSQCFNFKAYREPDSQLRVR